MMCELLGLQAGHIILRHTVVEQGVLTLTVESRSKRCRCPLCHKFSYHIHSQYQRYIRALPCFAKTTLIHLTAHKFYCRNLYCPQKVFTERFTTGITPHQRRTQRLTERLLSLVCQLSGRSAERICQLLGIDVSDTTLGRLLQKQSLPALPTPAIGILKMT